MRMVAYQYEVERALYLLLDIVLLISCLLAVYWLRNGVHTRRIRREHATVKLRLAVLMVLASLARIWMDVDYNLVFNIFNPYGVTSYIAVHTASVLTFGAGMKLVLVSAELQYHLMGDLPPPCLGRMAVAIVCSVGALFLTWDIAAGVTLNRFFVGLAYLTYGVFGIIFALFFNVALTLVRFNIRRHFNSIGKIGNEANRQKVEAAVRRLACLQFVVTVVDLGMMPVWFSRGISFHWDSHPTRELFYHGQNPDVYHFASLTSLVAALLNICIIVWLLISIRSMLTGLQNGKRSSGIRSRNQSGKSRNQSSMFMGGRLPPPTICIQMAVIDPAKCSFDPAKSSFGSELSPRPSSIPSPRPSSIPSDRLQESAMALAGVAHMAHEGAPSAHLHAMDNVPPMDAVHTADSTVAHPVDNAHTGQPRMADVAHAVDVRPADSTAQPADDASKDVP